MLNILIADDNDDLRELLREFLITLGHQVITVENGLKALNVFQEKGSVIDLLISDIMMPEMNGIDMIKQVRKQNQFMPIIVFSGFVDPELIREAEKLNVTVFEKPVHFESIEALIASVI